MRRCKVLRVFSRGDPGGNYLGVVGELSGLDTAAMQEIAVHLGFSETIFLDFEGRETPVARIFTPGAEIPFAGHPLVGAAWVLGNAAPGVVTGIECGIGRVALEASPTTARIEVAPDAVVESAEYSGREVAVQARLPAPVGAWMVTKGNEYLVIETEDPGAVPMPIPTSRRCDPSRRPISSLAVPAGCMQGSSLRGWECRRIRRPGARPSLWRQYAASKVSPAVR